MKRDAAQATRCTKTIFERKSNDAVERGDCTPDVNWDAFREIIKYYFLLCSSIRQKSKQATMDSELTDRSNVIQQRITQLRDSL